MAYSFPQQLIFPFLFFLDIHPRKIKQYPRKKNHVSKKKSDPETINLSYLSGIMRKPTICLCENKGADQLHSNCEADLRLCFRYMDSTFSFLLKSEISSFCDCTGRFVSDLVKNFEDQFSHVLAYLCTNTNKG